MITLPHGSQCDTNLAAQALEQLTMFNQMHKDLIEQRIKDGRVHLAPDAMQNPAAHEQVNVVSHVETTKRR